MKDAIKLRAGSELKAKQNPYKALTEDEFLKKLATAREHAAQGMYKDATEVLLDMKEKYGLGE